MYIYTEINFCKMQESRHSYKTYNEIYVKDVPITRRDYKNAYDMIP